MDRIRRAEIFLAAADSGSFTVAARQMGLTQPGVSKAMAELERQLDARLFARTTRSLALTDAGLSFLPHARALVAAAAAAEGALAARDPLAGIVAFSAPPSLANARIIPMLAPFLRDHPQVEIDARLSDMRAALGEGGLDFSIRVGGLGDDPVAARQIGVARRILVAAPAYLARHGTPRSAGDLAAHQCLHYRLFDGRRRWALTSGVTIDVAGPLSIDNPEGLRAAALAGLGIVQSAIWLFEEDLAAGRLVAVLSHDPPVPMPIHLVTARARSLTPRARHVADYLAARFAADPLLRLPGASDQAAS